MKRIIQLSLMILFLVSFSQLTKAQSSTFSEPWPGATHTYTFGSVDGGHTTTWWLSKDPTGINPLDQTDFAFVTIGGSYDAATAFDGGATGTKQLSGTGISTVKIRWNESALDKYYLFLNVDDGICSNLKGYMIDVQTGQFNALVADVTGSKTPGTIDPSLDPTDPAYDITKLTCPDETTISPIVNEGIYGLGESEITFRINREYINSVNNWQVAFSLRADASVKEVKDAAGNGITADASDYYLVDGDQDYVLVTVTVKNELATTAVVLTLDKENTIDFITKAKDNKDGDNKATHTFNAMPNIGGISGS